jgi:hypothetical protein
VCIYGVIKHFIFTSFVDITANKSAAGDEGKHSVYAWFAANSGPKRGKNRDGMVPINAVSNRQLY